MVGMDRSDCFKYLVERVQALISGWKEKILSVRGKELLINAVSQAILVFAMTIFNIPENFFKGISDAVSQLWCGVDDDDDHKRMHWVAWCKMGIPKEKGGMGFQDLQTLKQLCCKKCWRLMHEPDSLCARVLRTRYYPNCNLLKAGQTSGNSFTWNSHSE
jgi:hypothetical protein